MYARGTCVWHHLLPTQLSFVWHPCPQRSPRTASCDFCSNHSVKFAHQIFTVLINACLSLVDVSVHGYSYLDDTGGLHIVLPWLCFSTTLWTKWECPAGNRNSVLSNIPVQTYQQRAALPSFHDCATHTHCEICKKYGGSSQYPDGTWNTSPQLNSTSTSTSTSTPTTPPDLTWRDLT